MWTKYDICPWNGKFGLCCSGKEMKDKLGWISVFDNVPLATDLRELIPCWLSSHHLFYSHFRLSSCQFSTRMDSWIVVHNLYDSLCLAIPQISAARHISDKALWMVLCPITKIYPPPLFFLLLLEDHVDCTFAISPFLAEGNKA